VAANERPRKKTNGRAAEAKTVGLGGRLIATFNRSKNAIGSKAGGQKNRDRKELNCPTSFHGGRGGEGSSPRGGGERYAGNGNLRLKLGRRSLRKSKERGGLKKLGQ